MPILLIGVGGFFFRACHMNSDTVAGIVIGVIAIVCVGIPAIINALKGRD